MTAAKIVFSLVAALNLCYLRIAKLQDMNKPIIYQMLPRLWGNTTQNPTKDGNLTENGTGKFSDIDESTLDYLIWTGCSHVWFTGVIRHSTQESTAGCTPSHPQFVKGKAGSPYAICDYYDVNAYLADDPSRRMQEFEDLIGRCHDKGLKVIIDFVPNHVSRDYGKVDPTPGHTVLGAEDDKSVHWKAENDFFYYPGEALTLPTQSPEGMEPYMEYPAMATGNNCYNAHPGINDWFETVKINYCDFHTATWDKMYDIISYWMGKGVDGFRCDMVELVPPQFFKWLISKAKTENPEIIFIAEVYQKDLYNEYIRNVGFDYLYDKSGLYDTLRAVVDNSSATGITHNWQSLGELQPNLLNFLENHDEQRFCSDFFGKSITRVFAPLYTSLFLNTAPFMIYFGEEAGERGMDHEGFSGRDGRTTIFDWWSVGSVRRLLKVIRSKAYLSGSADILVENGMNREEAECFIRFTEAVRFAADDNAIRKGKTFDLCYCNLDSPGFNEHSHFAFLRSHEGHTMLFAANFSESDTKMNIRIPEHAFEWMNIPVSENLYPGIVLQIDVKASDAAKITLI